MIKFLSEIGLNQFAIYKFQNCFLAISADMRICATCLLDMIHLLFRQQRPQAEKALLY